MSVTSPSMRFSLEFIVPEMHLSQWGRPQVPPENTLLPSQKTLPKSHETLRPLGLLCLICWYSSQSLQMNETTDAFFSQKPAYHLWNCEKKLAWKSFQLSSTLVLLLIKVCSVCGNEILSISSKWQSKGMTRNHIVWKGFSEVYLDNNSE